MYSCEIRGLTTMTMGSVTNYDLPGFVCTVYVAQCGFAAFVLCPLYRCVMPQSLHRYVWTVFACFSRPNNAFALQLAPPSLNEYTNDDCLLVFRMGIFVPQAWTGRTLRASVKLILYCILCSCLHYSTELSYRTSQAQRPKETPIMRNKCVTGLTRMVDVHLYSFRTATRSPSRLYAAWQS